MSIDLSKCDRYDYHLIFRPDGQTIVNATKIATATALKSQIMNIPSRYATSQYKAKKFYFVLNSAQVGRADAASLFNTSTSSNNLYLTIGGLNNDTYSNFYNLASTSLEDNQGQEVQPAPLLFHVKVEPLKNLLGQTPFGTDGHVDGIEAPAKTQGFIGKVFLKHKANPESIIGANISDHCVPRVSATPGMTDSEKYSLLEAGISKTVTTLILNEVTEQSYHSDTLNGAITDSATDIIVSDNSVLLASVGSLIQIDIEVMAVTGVAGNTLTVTRGYYGTTAEGYADATAVHLLIDHFPVVGDFVRVNNEIMLVNSTTTANTTITVSRGSVNTIKAAHALESEVHIQINEQSYFETTVRAKYNAGSIVIQDIANEGFELDGATINIVDDNQFNKTKEIGNPFGNNIKVGLFHNTLKMSQKNTSTATEYNLVPTQVGFHGALSINFSILCVKE
jgi:hypothetical protein